MFLLSLVRFSTILKFFFVGSCYFQSQEHFPYLGTLQYLENMHKFSVDSISAQLGIIYLVCSQNFSKS